MKVNILSDEKMRELGFTDKLDGEWYYFKRLHKNISFNLSIIKSTGENGIIILDEEFGQAYDYQAILASPSRDSPFAKTINSLVQGQMIYLMDAGIMEDYQLGDYI